MTSQEAHYLDSGEESMVDWKETYQYDKNGNLKEQTYKDAYGAADIRYAYQNTYANGKLKKAQRDDKNGYGESATITCTYDKKGALKIKKITNSDSVETWTYANGQMKKYVYKATGGSQYQVIKKYNKLGLLISQETKYTDGMSQDTKTTYKCTYKDGLCTWIDEENGYSMVYYTTGYRAGRLKDVSYDNSGMNTTTYEYTQDAKSKQVATMTGYYAGEEVSKTVYTYKKVPATAVNIAQLRDY